MIKYKFKSQLGFDEINSTLGRKMKIIIDTQLTRNNFSNFVIHSKERLTKSLVCQSIFDLEYREEVNDLRMLNEIAKAEIEE